MANKQIASHCLPFMSQSAKTTDFKQIHFSLIVEIAVVHDYDVASPHWLFGSIPVKGKRPYSSCRTMASRKLGIDK